MFSVIIPTLNEEKNIGQLLSFFKGLNHHALLEIIVVDGDSTDDTLEIAKQYPVKTFLSPKRGRACQMNLGARQASGAILFFVHADVLPPHSCFDDILAALNDRYHYGCFAYHFSSENKWLNINSLFTRFSWMASGGGDQTLFIRKKIFESMGRFDENYCIMEDFDFIRRIKKKYPMKVINKPAQVSARKYDQNNYLKIQLANFLVFLLFRWGINPQFLKRIYHQMLTLNK